MVRLRHATSGMEKGLLRPNNTNFLRQTRVISAGWTWGRGGEGGKGYERGGGRVRGTGGVGESEGYWRGGVGGGVGGE